MESVLQKINAAIWGIPVLILILFVGIYLTLRSRFAQFRLLPKAIRQFIHCLNDRSEDNRVSGYRALCTALAGTVGTGNIAGIAGAIALGGAGVIFWMWICAFLGMIIKCAEVVLAVHFRENDSNGALCGGPMYIIKNGMPIRFHYLAQIYSFFGVIAALGVGNATQVNAVTDGIKNIASAFSIHFGHKESVILGVIIAVIIIPVFLKGAVGIGRMAERLVPPAAAIYIFIALVLLILRIQYLPNAFNRILEGAFSPKAVTGGVLGSAFITLRVGVSRGIFTNEAGMGTASIAHASAQVHSPMDQGLMGIVEVFLDTVVICTLTGLVILCSDIPIQYGIDPGIALTLNAFSVVLGDWCRVLLTILTCIFAFATILGWGLYGARCCQFLLGRRGTRAFIAAQSITVVLSSVLNTSVIWLFSEIVNGLMAIPNLIALMYLSDVFIRHVKDSSGNREAYSIK